ncbi:MAG: enoyl-CoA hydratase/isomerase family protein [Halobacteriota archaeon]
MAKDSIIVETTDDGITTLTVNRPEKLNALNVETLESIETVLADTAVDTRVLVLTGAGEEAFIAGADISHMQSLTTPEAQAYAELGHRIANTIETYPAPTIAAINGYAFGGGCELALACDFRVASERAVIGQTEIDLGIIPGWGGSQRLPRLVGDEVARRLIFFGERIDAIDARELGLVSEVFAHEKVDERVLEMATELAEKPRFALAAAKEAINVAHEQSPSAGMAYEKRAWSGLFGTHDQREGMKAFLEKRDPAFE